MFEDVKEILDPEREKKEYHFFYNHEERIKNAPQIVKDYYAGKMKPLRGFQALYKNKANLYILLALVFFVGVAWIYTGFNRSRNYAKIQGIDCQLTAFSYDDTIYASCKFSPNPRSKRNEPAQIQVKYQAINADKQLAWESEKDYGSLEAGGELFLRTKLMDYDIIRVDALVSVDGEEKELSTPVKR
ncbi:hypothetical protein [Treponema sp. C6A8]|uniref:hypothetical protein n=1 Tax=Treponema sp. C6A8 TaxID=1410609 RepID=UPI00047FCA24|nr:hypothetical protein [Treponema sp. C6A8]